MLKMMNAHMIPKLRHRVEYSELRLAKKTFVSEDVQNLQSAVAFSLVRYPPVLSMYVDMYWPHVWGEGGLKVTYSIGEHSMTLLARPVASIPFTR